MIKFKLKYINLCCFVMVTMILAYFTGTPYRIKSKLPKVSLSQVEKVLAWESGDAKTNLLEDGTFDLESFLMWYNQAKELRTDIGTTPDFAIVIYLKDNSRITIWTLYSKEWVTIGYEDEKDYYYQTVAESKDLASFIESARKNAGLN